MYVTLQSTLLHNIYKVRMQSACTCCWATDSQVLAHRVTNIYIYIHRYMLESSASAQNIEHTVPVTCLCG